MVNTRDPLAQQCNSTLFLPIGLPLSCVTGPHDSLRLAWSSLPKSHSGNQVPFMPIPSPPTRKPSPTTGLNKRQYIQVTVELTQEEKAKDRLLSFDAGYSALMFTLSPMTAHTHLSGRQEGSLTSACNCSSMKRRRKDKEEPCLLL